MHDRARADYRVLSNVGAWQEDSADANIHALPDDHAPEPGLKPVW